MNAFISRLHAWLLDAEMADDVVNDAVVNDAGQATTEYALVLLGAALIALLVIGWATTGGGSSKIGQLFDTVIDSVIGKL
jgi:Flp pilus assembly pilin Flp